ncbi:MAG: hypothetical protein COA43_10565 [Robiginitomaculum sp.]|nr:MAG: hypothetical protein COA43_10565 [Robiginitomaculum sp.]
MARKHIFVIKGIEKAGKTTVVNLIRNLLIGKHPNHKEIDYLTPRHHKEIKRIIIIGSIKIGLESQGDPSSRIYESIPFFVEEACDIIICATRTSGRTVNLINEYKLSHEIHWYEPIFSPNSPDNANDKKASEIFSEIVHVISNLQRSK